MTPTDFADRHNIPDRERGAHIECSSCPCHPTVNGDEWTHRQLDHGRHLQPVA